MICMLYIPAIKGVNVLKRKQAITAIKTHFKHTYCSGRK